jgi:hypothetical protein
MFITSRDLQMLFAAAKHLVEGLSLETLLTLKVEKSLICLVGTRDQLYQQQNDSQFVLENVNKKYSVKILSSGIKRFKM